MIPVADTIDKCRPVILISDPAVKNPAKYLEYRRTGNEQLLELAGIPRRFLCRPLDLEEWSYVQGVEEEANIGVARLVAVRIGLVAIDESDGETRTDLEGDRRVLWGRIMAVPLERLEAVLGADDRMRQQAAIMLLADHIYALSGLTDPLP